MREVIYYEADDGTRFEEERDCFNYEFKQKIENIVGNGLKMFDANRKEIAEYTYDSIYDAFAIQVLTIEGAKFVVAWADDYKTEAPFDEYDIEDKDEDLLGVWVYDAFGRGGWTHLDKLRRDVDELYFALQ